MIENKYDKLIKMWEYGGKGGQYTMHEEQIL